MLFTQAFRYHSRRGVKTCKRQKDKMSVRKIIDQIWQGSCTCEPTVAGVSCSRLAEEQVSQLYHVEEEGLMKSPPC